VVAVGQIFLQTLLGQFREEARYVGLGLATGTNSGELIDVAAEFSAALVGAFFFFRGVGCEEEGIWRGALAVPVFCGFVCFVVECVVHALRIF
jgi:hypothetical protein